MPRTVFAFLTVAVWLGSLFLLLANRADSQALSGAHDNFGRYSVAIGVSRADVADAQYYIVLGDTAAGQRWLDGSGMSQWTDLRPLGSSTIGSRLEYIEGRCAPMMQPGVHCES